MTKARSANVSARHDEPGNGYDPFSFAHDMLAYQRQFLGLGSQADRGSTLRPAVSEPLELMNTILNSCTQMLGMTALATETMRFVTRQAQIQVEYMRALRECRTWADVGSINMEFTRRIAQDTSDQLRALGDATQRVLAGGEQVGRAGLRH